MVSFRRLAVVVVAVTVAVVVEAASAAPTYPRLGAVLISSPQNYEDAEYQAQIARVQVVVLDAWQGWRGYSGNVTTLDAVVKHLKVANPTIKVFNYTMLEQIGAGQGSEQGFSEQLQKVSAMNWWVYTTGVAGERLQSAWQGNYGPFYEINVTGFVPSDGAGQIWTDWFAAWADRNFLVPNPNLDGLYLDSVSWFPYAAKDGDWNRDGTTDLAKAPATAKWYRQGYQHYFQALRRLAPGTLQIANLANWGDPNSNLTEYDGLINGGIIEGIMGFSWSPETRGGWPLMLQYYRKTMAAIAAPKLVIFHQDLAMAADYQAMRYGLTSCLMDDGYYAASVGGNYHDVLWYDEFDSLLGQASSAPPTSAWQHGVYRRDFANGIALVNPRGNGTQTVVLEAPYKKLSGTQAPDINNGQTVTSVQLNDRDGLILLKVSAAPTPVPAPLPVASRPGPVGSVTVQ